MPTQVSGQGNSLFKTAAACRANISPIGSEPWSRRAQSSPGLSTRRSPCIKPRNHTTMSKDSSIRHALLKARPSRGNRGSSRGRSSAPAISPSVHSEPIHMRVRKSVNGSVIKGAETSGTYTPRSDVPTTDAVALDAVTLTDTAYVSGAHPVAEPSSSSGNGAFAGPSKRSMWLNSTASIWLVDTARSRNSSIAGVVARSTLNAATPGGLPRPELGT
ncbi:hypothetical protein C2E23DRAFT_860984 [Lenzites betulinus]|nr:hypothetical protein C2E23DRAFT_860984 [Lenzites betulinus]